MIHPDDVEDELRLVLLKFVGRLINEKTKLEIKYALKECLVKNGYSELLFGVRYLKDGRLSVFRND